MEMRCYRKILRISYKDHVTNEEVRAKIQQAIGPHEDLLPLWWWLFPRVRGFGENVRQFILRLRFFSEVEISSRTLIPLFGQDQSTVTQRAETTDRVFPDETRVSSFQE